MPPRLLVVIPHPDDESYAFGGTLALAARSGSDIRLVCATRGELGERHDGVAAEPATLGDARECELRDSCAILGVAETTVWSLPDGELDAYESEGKRLTVEAIDDFSPDLVLTLGLDGAYGHPDHLAVQRWVCAALAERTDVTGLYASFLPGQMLPQYELCAAAGVLGQPPALGPAELGSVLADYEVGTGHVRATKLASIAAHRTQLPGGDPRNLFPEGLVDELLNVERFVDARGQPFADTARLIAGFAVEPPEV